MKKKNEKNEKKEIILKHDLLQRINRTFTTIDEQRGFNSCLVDLFQRETLDEQRYYPVNVSRFAERQGIGNAKAFQELLPIINEFTKELFIKLDDGKVWVTRIIYDYRYREEDKVIEVRFNRELIPYISGEMNAGNFSLYDGNMDRVPSNRRYLFSELIQRNLFRFKFKDTFSLEIEGIREALGLSNNEYREYRDFNKRIIKETMKDVAKLKKIYIIAKKNKEHIIFSKVTEDIFIKTYL